MGQFNHPFVVKLYGVVTVEDPVSVFVSKTHICAGNGHARISQHDILLQIMICIELMTGGDLRGYLGTLSPQ